MYREQPATSGKTTQLSLSWDLYGIADSICGVGDRGKESTQRQRSHSPRHCNCNPATHLMSKSNLGHQQNNRIKLSKIVNPI